MMYCHACLETSPPVKLLKTSLNEIVTEPKLMLVKNNKSTPMKSAAKRNVFRFVFGKLVQFLKEIQLVIGQYLRIGNFYQIF